MICLLMLEFLAAAKIDIAKFFNDDVTNDVTNDVSSDVSNAPNFIVDVMFPIYTLLSFARFFYNDVIMMSS